MAEKFWFSSVKISDFPRPASQRGHSSTLARTRVRFLRTHRTDVRGFLRVRFFYGHRAILASLLAWCRCIEPPPCVCVYVCIGASVHRFMSLDTACLFYGYLNQKHIRLCYDCLVCLAYGHSLVYACVGVPVQGGLFLALFAFLPLARVRAYTCMGMGAPCVLGCRRCGHSLVCVSSISAPARAYVRMVLADPSVRSVCVCV